MGKESIQTRPIGRNEWEVLSFTSKVNLQSSKKGVTQLMEQQGPELNQSYRHSFHLPHTRSITIRNAAHSKLQFTLKKVNDKKG